jgi:hypothetical protein
MLKLDEDIIPDPAVILVTSEPLEHDSEHHVHACSARVSAVRIFGSFSNQDLLRFMQMHRHVHMCACTHRCMCMRTHVQVIPA